MGAQYTGSFELRRLVMVMTRAPVGGTQEDAAMITLRFAKLTSGAPDSNWLTADYTAVENAANTWWTGMKASFSSVYTLARYDWYKSGPVWEPADLANGPPNPRTRTTAVGVVGTNGSNMLPPQVAATITLLTGTEKKRWGRFYLPGGCTDVVGPDGRIATSRIGPTGTWNTATVTFLNSCRSAGLQPVVFSRGRSAYTTAKGASIPAHSATAYEITSIQIDNLFDVMRTRRWDGPTFRQVTALT